MLRRTGGDSGMMVGNNESFCLWGPADELEEDDDEIRSDDLGSTLGSSIGASQSSNLGAASFLTFWIYNENWKFSQFSFTFGIVDCVLIAVNGCNRPSFSSSPSDSILKRYSSMFFHYYYYFTYRHGSRCALCDIL